MKLSDYVVDFVVKQGVKHVFMLPGGGAIHLNDSLGRRTADLEYVCALHEQGAAIAAEAYARISGGLGVAMVTSGPGGTNAVTGLAGAWLDSTPCLFLSGQAKRADLKTGTDLRQLGSQEVDIVSIVHSITKYAVTVTDPSAVRYHLEKALYLATSGRPGPVWLDFPLDVQASQIDPEALEGFIPEETTPVAPTKKLTDQVSTMLRMLKEAQRPVVVAGNGIHVAHARDVWERVMESAGIPVLTTWLGLDLISDDHPLFGGRPGGIAPRGANYTLQNSDLMIVIGARLDMAFTGYSHANLARHASKVIVDVDPAEILKMKTTIHLPIVADAGDFLREWESQAKLISNPVRYPTWCARVQEWKERYPVVQDVHRQADQRISVYNFSDVLSECLQEGDLVVTGSSGTAVELFLLSVRTKRGQRFLHNRGLGAMGFGLPGAIGACFAAGRKPVVSVDGEGGFQMNIQELAVAAHHQLPITYFVVNNEGYASIRNSQEGYFKLRVGADSTSGLTLPDLSAIAAAYRVSYHRIADQSNLLRDVRAVLSQPGPKICELISQPDEVRAPRITSVQRADGSMVSKPLEDLWPFLSRDEYRANMLVPILEE